MKQTAYRRNTHSTTIAIATISKTSTTGKIKPSRIEDIIKVQIQAYSFFNRINSQPNPHIIPESVINKPH